MSTGRLEAFSDGVLAIIITLMVLELKIPAGHTFTALRKTTATGLLSYLLSFAYVGIYWNNHHHTFQLTRKVDGGVLWGNLALLFFLSLLPFTTNWMDDSDFARTPVMVYGIDLLLIAFAYFVLQATIIRAEGPDSPLRDALGRDWKGKASVVLYLVGIVGAALNGPTIGPGVYVALGTFVLVAILWVVPDRRIVRRFTGGPVAD